MWAYSTLGSNKIIFNWQGSGTTGQNSSEIIPGKHSFTRSSDKFEVNYMKSDQIPEAPLPLWAGVLWETQ